MKIGVSLHDFWDYMTPKQFQKYIEAWEEKETIRAREIDANNHNLGLYIRSAFHDPKKYPKKPLYEKSKEEKKPMTPKELDSVMHGYYLKFKDKKK